MRVISILIITIRYPFQNIAMQIMKPKTIGSKTPNRCRLLKVPATAAVVTIRIP